MTRLWVCSFVLATLIVGCSDTQECTVPDNYQPGWIKVIGCERDYELLWEERADAVFASTRTINWLIDREDSDRVYFINSRQWQLHYLFAAAELNHPGRSPVGTHAEFNLLNYRRPNRRFVLGKLIHYLDQQLVTIELSAGDTAGADMIVAAFKRLAASVFNGSALKYRPVSAAQEAILGDIGSRIPTIRTEAVFDGQQYQPLNQRVGFGTLRFARVAELAATPALPTEIIVLDRVPNDISIVSGVITQEFQTPLSHINILSKNRGTPNMALRDAFDNKQLRAMEGSLVRLEVSPQEFTIAAATSDEAKAYWDSLRPSEPVVPSFDLSLQQPQDLGPLDATAARFIGAKAANMAEMTRLRTRDGHAIPLPDMPFALPFHTYEQHLRDNGMWDLVEQLLDDHAVQPLDPATLRRRLFALRWAIYSAPIRASLLARVTNELETRYGTTTRVRFRSSTNAEDLPNFSGAGLYTSAGATLEEGQESIANAIRVVWASTWNYQAFVERDFYRVDHRSVYMGVLIHPAFAGELANGVALTINEFTTSRPAFYINSQVGEVSVTNPTGEATPEQILYYTWYEEPEYEVITRSSLIERHENWPAGPAIFTDSELNQLADYLGVIHHHFRQNLSGGAEFAMDVEFKLAPGRRLVIKQARPLKQR